MCSIMELTRKTISDQQIWDCSVRTRSRRPDCSSVEETGEGVLCFHRLAMGLHPDGMQPFPLGSKRCVYNGERYGFRKLKRELEAGGYTFERDFECGLRYEQPSARVLSNYGSSGK